MWKPRRLTTLWAFTACYRDSFLLLGLDVLFRNTLFSDTLGVSCDVSQRYETLLFQTSLSFKAPLTTTQTEMKWRICRWVIVTYLRMRSASLQFQGTPEGAVTRIGRTSGVHCKSFCLEPSRTKWSDKIVNENQYRARRSRLHAPWRGVTSRGPRGDHSSDPSLRFTLCVCVRIAYSQLIF
jgi:hypothetical protein